MGRRHPKSWTQSIINLTTIRMTSRTPATTVESTMDTQNVPLKMQEVPSEKDCGVEQDLNPNKRYDSDRSSASTETFMTSASSSQCLLTMLEDDEGDVDENVVVREEANVDDHSCDEDSAKHVRFSTASARVYPQVLGDHPYCSVGCPLELGWKYCKEETLTISDDSSEDSSNNNSWCYRLTAEERLAIVQPHYSEQEVRKACRRRNRHCCDSLRSQRKKLQKEFFGAGCCLRRALKEEAAVSAQELRVLEVEDSEEGLCSSETQPATA